MPKTGPVALFTDFWALGSERRDFADVTWVRNRSAPTIGYCNVVSGLGGDDPETVAAQVLLAEHWIDAPNAYVLVGAGSDATEASLILAGWRLKEAVVELVTDAPLPTPDANSALIRPAVTDADWEHMGLLFRSDHVEEDKAAGRQPRPINHTDEAVLARRLKMPAVDYWIAWDGEAACGFFSSWPRSDEAVVEDLFVAASHRGRGVAKHLLHHGVQAARSRGADRVHIRADVDDWPKSFYHRMGFRPHSVSRFYTRA